MRMLNSFSAGLRNRNSFCSLSLNFLKIKLGLSTAAGELGSGLDLVWRCFLFGASFSDTFGEFS